MDEVVSEFLAESSENLARVDQAFLVLEQDPTATGVIADVFRTLHTLKGTCGFLGLSKLERLSHSGESLLARIRDGERRFDPRVSQALFELVDAVRAVLASIESTGAEGSTSYGALIAELDALAGDLPAEPPAPLPAPAAKPTDPPPAARPAAASIRIDVGQLDRLMNQVGELVLARNQLRAHADASELPGLRATAQRLAAIAGDLQESVMRTRMQPIGSAWSSVPRLVRDLCAQTGKRVHVELSGAETAIDRGILDALRDPLTHMVRNAVDHGVETPAARARAGKPEEGNLALRAWTQSGFVRLDIEDDGAGIDPGLLRRRALECGLIDRAEAARMSDAEALGLIFRAGFSTAEEVSNLSGRGVGMDVVKTNLERLGGAVHVSSRPGRGTRIELRIPLTLAVMPVLLVDCAGQRFALPSAGAVEVLRLADGDGPGSVERVHGALVLRRREALLPLVSLRQVLGLSAPSTEGFAVVLESEARRFGLLVDTPLDIEEIVVKPLGAELGKLDVFSGATILGDGCVALILDVLALARRGKVRRAREGEAEPPAEPAPGPPARRLLVCELEDYGCVALELDCVERLEEAPVPELCGGRMVLPWQGDVLPLSVLAEELSAAQSAPPAAESAPPRVESVPPTVESVPPTVESVPPTVESAPPTVESVPPRVAGRPLVAICAAEGRRLALGLPRALDVAEEPVALRPAAGRRWIRGSFALRGRPALLVDLPALVRERGAAAGSPPDAP